MQRTRPFHFRPPACMPGDLASGRLTDARPLSPFSCVTTFVPPLLSTLTQSFVWLSGHPNLHLCPFVPPLLPPFIHVLLFVSNFAFLCLFSRSISRTIIPVNSVRVWRHETQETVSCFLRCFRCSHSRGVQMLLLNQWNFSLVDMSISSVIYVFFALNFLCFLVL